MTVCIDYKDTITIIKPQVSGYGSETMESELEVPALFFQNTGWSKGVNELQINSDAYAYVDPTNAFVLANWNRLEGMLVIANPFGADAAEAWYRIVNVTIAQDKLLCNNIDNIVIQLDKSTEIPRVS